MKHRLIIACSLVLIVNFAGCAETMAPANEASQTNQAEVAAETPTAETAATPARTPLPANVRKGADGNLIKPDGWPIQEVLPKETKKRTETGKTRNGRTVIFNVLSITPEGRPVAEAALPYSEGGDHKDYYEWRIYHVRELSGRDGKIFCYEYSASLFMIGGNANSGMTTATSYRLCDYEGDGKYEFNGSGYEFTIPDWVKTLPGDPNAVDNNANW